MATTHVDHGALEAKRLGLPGRSPEWPAVEKAHLTREPHCTCCTPNTNVLAGLQVHHRFPFHYCVALGRPDLELDDRNLITLCEDEAGKPGENHHLLVGHLDDFKSSNLDVVLDARTTFNGMTSAAIRASEAWKAKVAKRLKPLDEMTPQDQADFTSLMNDTFPRKVGEPVGSPAATVDAGS